MRAKLTKRVIENLACQADKAREFVRDTDCRGLVVEVRRSGGKTYYLSYRDDRGKQRLHKLANAADITPQQARALCEQERSRLQLGVDIARARRQHRRSLTVDEFFFEKYLPYVQSYKRSWHTDATYYRKHAQQHIGHKRMEAVTQEDIVIMLAHASAHLAPTTCHRLFVIVRYMFNVALRWKIGTLAENPTDGQAVRRAEVRRERFLTHGEAQRLLASVNESPNPMLKYIIPFLLMTGARKREVLDARWRDVDYTQQFWRIPYTKAGVPRHVPLTATAFELLASVPRYPTCIYIFPNPKTKLPYNSVFRAWDTARRRVGLGDVRIHDLRHSFASFLVNAGCSLYEVQKLLGHSSLAMTQRYSHLRQDKLMQAATVASDAIGKTWAND